MANKREFKKYVDAVGASAIAPMVDAYESVKGADKEKITNAIEKVLGACGAAKSHADVFFDKGMKAFESHKEYAIAKKNFFKELFKKINDDFANELDEAIKEFNSAIPQEVKDSNKAAVNK